MELRDPHIERRQELEPKIIGGRFSLVGRVGNGYYTRRYRAKDMQDNDRLVSLKYYDWRAHYTKIGYTLFKWHVENAAALDPHPNIIPNRLVGYEEVDGKCFYVIQDNIEGVPATTWVRSAKTPKLAVERLVHVLEGVCTALQRAWNRHELQYCLKPGDVLIENGTDTVKVGDIGVYPSKLWYMYFETYCSRYCEDPIPILPDYWDVQMQGVNIEPGPRSCVYALGILAYEMAVGRPPFGGRSADAADKHVHQQIPPLAKCSTLPLPAWLLEIINRCLQKDPGLRYTCAHDVASILGNERARAARPSLLRRLAQKAKSALTPGS